MTQFDHADILTEKFNNNRMLTVAKEVLAEGEQSEEAFLGAQGILLLNGLL